MWAGAADIAGRGAGACPVAGVTAYRAVARAGEEKAKRAAPLTRTLYLILTPSCRRAIPKRSQTMASGRRRRRGSDWGGATRTARLQLLEGSVDALRGRDRDSNDAA